MKDDDRGSLALAQFAIAALTLYVQDVRGGQSPAMTLREIAFALLAASEVL